MPRGLTFTRDGKIFVLISLGVGFAAVNTGNNLLFLVLGMMLGMIIISGILSEMTLRNVTITRHLPRRVEANTIFPAQLALRNDKRWAASFSVELRDEIDGRPFRRRCFFLKVGPGAQRSIAYRCELPLRGLSHFDGTIVSTRFPFGLFEKTRFIALKDEVIVLPASVPVGVPPRAAMTAEGALQVGVCGSGQDFLELREMVPGDDSRRIDWRSTARLGRPVVRETERDADGFVEIVLDASPVDGTDEALENVEHDISVAATMIRHMTARGLNIRLVTSGSVGIETHGGVGAVRLLEHLALLDPAVIAQGPVPVGASPAAIVIGRRREAVA